MHRGRVVNAPGCSLDTCRCRTTACPRTHQGIHLFFVPRIAIPFVVPPRLRRVPPTAAVVILATTIGHRASGTSTMKIRLATLLTSLVVSFASGGSEELLEKECEQQGYGELLRCSSCKHFEEIIADPSESKHGLYLHSSRSRREIPKEINQDVEQKAFHLRAHIPFESF